ncbi:MAG: tyrosine-type recombinase/integrase [Bacteroidales bacterium]|nr:tyrosine-type recombinase/integrase [Bacteroidales bacterium]
MAYLRDVRRYSVRTQAIYRAALDDFASWAGTSDITGHLIPSRLREYEGHLIEAGISPRTVHLHMSALSGFCNFLIKEGLMTYNPVRSVRRPKMGKRLPEYYTDKSLEEYFADTAHSASAEELRILETASGKLFADMYRRRLRRLIIVILYSTGIRRAELLGLTVGSVNMERSTLRVRGKGDKMREIPLVSSTTEEISLYLHAASLTGAERTKDSPLLVTEKGTPLYPVYIDRAVKQELGAAGIPGRKSPHVLRHSLATALLDEGADLEAIKQMLGHANLAATEVYTHNSAERLKAQYINAHPRAKKGDSYD